MYIWVSCTKLQIFYFYYYYPDVLITSTDAAKLIVFVHEDKVSFKLDVCVFRKLYFLINVFKLITENMLQNVAIIVTAIRTHSLF